MLKGSCLCGDITFTLRPGAFGDTNACHCRQCRKQSGHDWVSSEVAHADVDISGTPAWFEASPVAKRGFCARCGSLLFWQEHGAEAMNVSLGVFDTPTGAHIDSHIFVADKGDYYDITDGLPTHDQYEAASHD